jgi:hypothetical protein
MNTTTARESVKNRLDIDSSQTSFDTEIDDFVLSGVNRLYPIAQVEIPAQTVVVTVDGFGEATVDLSTLTTPALAARKVEACVAGGAYFPASETYHHGTNLTVRELPANSTVTLKIYGVAAFTLETVPDFLAQAVIWYAISEFYDLCASNKRKYNLYMDNGARAVDNMRDEADYYEQKANAYLNDRTTLYGVA